MTTHTPSRRSYLFIADPHNRLPAELRSRLQAHRRWIVVNDKTKHKPNVALLVVTEDETPSLYIHRFFTSVASIPMVIFDTAPTITRQLNAFQAGANGYMVPGITLPEFIPLLDIAMQGGFATCLQSHRMAQDMMRGPLEFSKREQEVVALYSLGASEAAVAEELGITVGTVQETIRRACRKCGANTPAALVMWWTRWSLSDGAEFDIEDDNDDHAVSTPYVMSA